MVRSAPLPEPKCRSTTANSRIREPTSAIGATTFRSAVIYSRASELSTESFIRGGTASISMRPTSWNIHLKPPSRRLALCAGVYRLLGRRRRELRRRRMARLDPAERDVAIEEVRRPCHLAGPRRSFRPRSFSPTRKSGLDGPFEGSQWRCNFVT
jgi:hypothetical protein